MSILHQASTSDIHLQQISGTTTSGEFGACRHATLMTESCRSKANQEFEQTWDAWLLLIAPMALDNCAPVASLQHSERGGEFADRPLRYTIPWSLARHSEPSLQRVIFGPYRLQQHESLRWENSKQEEERHIYLTTTTSRIWCSKTHKSYDSGRLSGNGLNALRGNLG